MSLASSPQAAPPSPSGAPALGARPGASSALPPVTWTHTDSALSKTLTAATTPENFERAVTRHLTTPERVRLLRGLNIATLYAVEGLVKGAMPMPGEMEGALRLGGELDAGLFPNPVRNRLASTLARTLYFQSDPGVHQVYNVTTRDGEPPVIDEKGPRLTFGEAPRAAGETGAWPLLVGAVIVVGIIGATVWGVFNGQQSAAVADRKLTEDAITERLNMTQARAINMVVDHLQREKDAGHPIPWDERERKLHDALLDTQGDLAKRGHEPLPAPYPGAPGSLLDRAGDIGIGVGGGLLLAGAAAVFFAMRSRGGAGNTAS